MTFGFRERERILDIFEMVSGLRMNSAYVRPGGVAQDLPEDGVQKIRETLPLLRRRLKDTVDLLVDNSIWMGRTVGVGYLDLTGCMALGITGPVLRATGLPHDLRKSAAVLRLRELRVRRGHRDHRATSTAGSSSASRR